MKPYSYEGYGGLDPDIFFWSMIGFSVLMFAILIFEETKHGAHWGKNSWIRIITSVTLWCIAFTVFVTVDVGKDRAFETTQTQLKEQIEKPGLTVTSGLTDPTPSTISTVNVLVKDKEGKEVEENCAVYSPDDINKEIGVICGSTANGMNPENLVKWYQDGSPTDEEEMKKYTLTAEESEAIAGSVTVEQAETPAAPIGS